MKRRLFLWSIGAVAEAVKTFLVWLGVQRLVPGPIISAFLRWLGLVSR